MKMFIALVLSISLHSQSIFACPRDSEAGQGNSNHSREERPDGCILDECRYWRPSKAVLSANSSGISPAEYSGIFSKINKVYAPIFKKFGFELLLESNWNDSTVQAFSTNKVNNPNRRKVYVSGGFARRSGMTVDALATVVCHEIGHHLGGYPIIPGKSWPASAEGQADYYATSKCLKLICSADVNENSNVASKGQFPEFLKEDCRRQFETEAEVNLCLRSMKAAEDISKTYVVEDLREMINFENMGGSEVPEIDFSHPLANCRLATLSSGALCNVSAQQQFNITEEKSGACLEGIGSRPLCWFKPSI